MKLAFDPERTLLLGRDEALPAIAAERLGASALRERFGRQVPWDPEVWSERPVPASPTAAAVMIALVRHEDRLGVLLTRRTDHLAAHPGQISFPGGRSEPEDADAVATALREAEEEIGLAARDAEVLGTLPRYVTGTGFAITPVVALVPSGLVLHADPFEVAEVFEVPLEFLMTPAHHERRRVEIDGLERVFFAMPWSGAGPDGLPRRYFIWGATAALLRNLYRFLGA